MSSEGPFIETTQVARTIRVALILKLQPKVLGGQLQLITPTHERTLLKALAGYELTVEALPQVPTPVDRFEGEVDIEPQQATQRIMQAEERRLIEAASVVGTESLPHTPPPLTNRRQQAAAILIATIALLTSLLQLLR